ncbi:MAG: hypothetical protein NTV23_09765 [Propionibacteriales bacterium]|nr:hypothetical protein [Propionibacteriales bacterium]
MSSPDPSARPAQVTVAGWSVAVASAFLLLSAFDSLNSLNSVETRDQLIQAIDEGNLKGLGISVAEALDVKRWALYVSALAAVVTGVLGIFVLQRDKTARIGLTVAAVPIVLTVPITGSFLAMLVGAGAAVLWTLPARDWFAGRPVTRREPRPAAPRDQSPPPAPAPWVPPTAVTPPGGPEPAASAGWGEAPATTTTYPAYDASTGSAVPLSHQELRPRQVRNACLITWVFSGLTAIGYLAVLVAVSIDSQAMIDMVTESPAWDPSYDEGIIVGAAVAGSILMLLWCAAVAVVAVFTWRGAPWARVVHLISTGVAAVFALLALPWSLAHLAAVGAVLGLLLSAPARSWFTSRRR